LGTGELYAASFHSDDMADACVYLMDAEYEAIERSDTWAPLLNVGCGADVTVRELAESYVMSLASKCRLVFDHSKPDGTPRKLLDVSRMNQLGW
jgi:GDP-L-fucose synthase